MKGFGFGMLISFLIITMGGCSSMSSSVDIKAEKARVEETIRDCIMWPYPEKNVDRLYSSLARSPSFFMFLPDSASTVTSFDEFDETIKTVYMDDKLKATSTEIRDLRINLSHSGDVAWFSCILDDFGEFGDHKWEWKNCRWTGVLEKIDGKWQIFQMHFSLPTDAKNENEEVEPGEDNG